MKSSSWNSLEKFLEKSFFSSACFTSGAYSHYFFSKLFLFLRSSNRIPKKVAFINPMESDFLSFEAALSQLLLGMNEWYWLGDCTALFTEKKYKGPHTLLYFIDEKKREKKLPYETVLLPTVLQEEDMEACLKILGKDAVYTSKKKIIKKLFEKVKTISLDQAFHFIDYLELVNVSSQDLLLAYLAPLYEEDHSLFTLSNFFFAKDRESFFLSWSVLEKKYPFPFWTAFWSDQIWRAYHTTFFLQKGDIDKARIISKRLPFAFIKIHWKYMSLEGLSAAYTFLFKSDYAFKTGSSFCAFDLFFASFFEGRFKSKTPSLDQAKKGFLLFN
jgi:hypothetical protein